MNKTEIKDKLLQDIQKTEKIIKDYQEQTKPVSPDDAIGRVSRMDAINNKSVVEASLRKAEEKLRGLEYVLDNIDDPDFGRCKNCKTEIPIGRILFRPESVLCVNCAR